MTLDFARLTGASPEPRNPQAWLPSAEALVDEAARATQAPEPAGLRALLQGTGAPVLDMVTTVFSARASVLGAQHGRAFFHHELRRRLAMPPALEPEIAVWDQGTVPIWRTGVLDEPKYFSFFQDAPLPSYNPNHRRKWRAHELLHGAVGFFWSPALTRFDLYVSARLNELLPVVHWYGLDEVFRPACPAHDGKLLHREYCQACEMAAKPFWELSEDWVEARRPVALGHARHALEHFTSEWEAMLAELDTGRVHETARPRLNASSDAVAYMQAHWNRVTAWSFGHWMELFMVPGLDYFDTLEELFAHSAGVTADFLSGPLTLDPADFTRRRTRRLLQDMGYRATLAMEWLEEDSKEARRAESLVGPHLEAAADLCHRLVDSPEAMHEVDEVLEGLLSALGEVTGFPEDIARALPATGVMWHAPEKAAHTGASLLVEGLESALPETYTALEERGELEAAMQAFALSEQFGALGRLGTRAAAFLGGQPGYGWLGELPQFEAWAHDEPRRDEEAELFGTLPEDLGHFSSTPARLRAHETLRRRAFGEALVARLTGEDEQGASTGPEDVMVAVVHMRGELRLAVEDAQTSAIFDAVAAGESAESIAGWVHWETLEYLLENGFVVWLPRPR